jgi:hypothetical protein
MSTKNIMRILLQASPEQYEQGLAAYQDYHARLKTLAEVNDIPFERVVGAFSALSPGNRLEMNFADLETLINAIKKNKEVSAIRLHCYSQCTQRGYDFLTGWEPEFKTSRKGEKTRNFYHNILNPESPDYVTIDRHAIEVHAGKEVDETLRKKIFDSPRKYNEIANDYKKVAKQVGLLPCQVQAITWYTWR